MKTVILLLLGIGVLTACKKASKDDGRICTAEYRFYNIKVTGASGEAVTLDTFYTRVVASNATFHANNVVPGAGNGYYTVASDGQLLLLPEGKDTELRFTGIKNNKIVVNESYIVKNNGCHIEEVSGKKEIVITQ
ncbi:hypothetical protein LQ567_13300 [Niabella pedocola]|uniref:Lipocalin-like domain-containing protein n=1 Tax=Niabella pedocola TaxID=1752077 RepID=A0ABS8PS98_9BACT|nr:hypothetical protein [Niabella pedocola]MCD2423745.1 hypothetical protein [Niabella pedocola]